MKWQKHIGLDIGSSTIKLVELAPAGERFRLQAFGQTDTPLAQDQPGWDQARVKAIKDLVNDSKASTRLAAISLPESLVYTRVVEMPAMAEPELTSTIRFQAEQYIPVPLTDVVLKHQVLSLPDAGAPGSKMSVLLVAAPNDVLSRYTMLLSNAGLELVAVETEILAVARAIIGLGSASLVTLLVHLGAESTILAVFTDGLLVLAQSINTGGAAIVRSVSSQLSLEYKQAEEYVKSYGLDQTKLDGKVAVAVKPIIELIINEVKRVIAFHQTRETAGPIKRVVLTGGMALLPGLIQHFTENIDLEVQLGNAFSGVDLTPIQVKEIGECSAQFATSVGLALKTL